jgi:sugar lactone lactonase YvrE
MAGAPLILALAGASPSMAQITFLGAQRTVAATGLGQPYGAAADAAGNIYIADSQHNQVVKVPAQGSQSVVSVAPLTLSGPVAVVADGAGNLFISDAGNNRVVKVPAGGGAATAFASVLTPGGLAVDSSGNVFVADNEDGFIVKITSAGVSSTFEMGLSDPVAVAVDLAGNVYLADASLSCVTEFPAGGGAGTMIGSGLSTQSGIAVDASGNVYVAVTGEGTVIVQIAPGGAETTLATTGLAGPEFMTIDGNYNLYIPDSTNTNVIEFSLKSVNLGFANVCASGAPTPCSQTAVLNFSVIEDGVTNVNVVTVGDEGFDFSSTASTCAGETSPCTVTVQFAPAVPGMRQGAVQLGDEGAGAELSFPVYGTGTGAYAGYQPALTSPPFGTDGFQDPTAVAVAGAGVFEGGPIFIADDEACVIWIAGEDAEDFEIYAGTYGQCDYSGDGGAATSATLNAPEDIALDGAGNLYIADAGNARVRKVDINGVITTVAGTGTASFSGDNGAATSAELNNPVGVGLDAAGNLYVADSLNQRVRKIDLNGIISTVAGSGTPGYTGDGGAATGAELNFPAAVRADAAGNLYIGDGGNSVVRKVNLTGTITTIAGNAEEGCGDNGDGGPATSAQLSFPAYLSIDAAGELFISDVGNGNVRLVSPNGIISTYAVPTEFPVDFQIDPTGNVAMVDPEEEAMTLQVRAIPLGFSYASQNINTASDSQDATVTNIGNQPLAITEITPPTGFVMSGADTTCSTESPLTLGASCVLGIAFDPPTAGEYEADVVVTDNSLGPAGQQQDIGVAGTGVAPLTSTSTALAASPTTAFAGQTVTLTATITPTPTGTLGTVNFCLGTLDPTVVTRRARVSGAALRQWAVHAEGMPNGSCGSATLLGTADVIANGTAVLAVTNLPVGADSVTAVFSGTGTLAISNSGAVTVTINAPASTTTVLNVSPNPGTAGETITLTATVSPTPTGTPLGSVTFCLVSDDTARVRRAAAGSRKFPALPARGSGVRGAALDSSPCGLDTALGMVTLTSSGTAALTPTNLAGGDDEIYAVYSGNAGFESSSSDTVDETVNPGYTVTAPQTPFDVSEGGAVQVMVTVPPLGGAFNNEVTLSASGLPQGATATFVPPTVTPGAEGAQTQMTIQLAQPGQQSGAAGPRGSWPQLPPMAAWCTALACILGFSLAGALRRRRPLPRMAMALLLAGGISLVALGMNGCNGGFAGLSTPKGNYIVTVTGTSGSLHASTTVTVVVQ